MTNCAKNPMKKWLYFTTCLFEIKKAVILIDVPCNEKNEISSKRFLKKFQTHWWFLWYQNKISNQTDEKFICYIE